MMFLSETSFVVRYSNLSAQSVNMSADFSHDAIRLHHHSELPAVMMQVVSQSIKAQLSEEFVETQRQLALSSGTGCAHSARLLCLLYLPENWLRMQPVSTLMNWRSKRMWVKRCSTLIGLWSPHLST